MSAFGTKQTPQTAEPMSAFGREADMGESHMKAVIYAAVLIAACPLSPFAQTADEIKQRNGVQRRFAQQQF